MTSSTPVLLPQLGLEVTEGRVNTVLVEVGAQVRRDQPLVELETDKAVTDVVAPADGVVLSIEVAEGDTVPVGAVLLHLGTGAPGEAAPVTAPREPPASNGASRDPVAPAAVAAAAVASAAVASAAPRLRVAPVARRAAAKLGIDVATLTGTGPRGRITLYDVEGAAATSAPPAAEPVDGREELSATRRAIARRMTASQLIPQYHLVRDVDATHLLAEKTAQAARGGAKVGVNDLLIQAIAETAVRHPLLATSFVDDDPPHLLRRDTVDVGLAVATDRGLVVPVIRAAHERGLAAIASDRRELVAAARSGRLSLGQMTGGTITLSSLAALDVDRFTAMVNPGESTIVAVGRTVEKLVPRGRTIAVVPTLTLTLSFDHRVVDGAVGAAALGELAGLLEGGMTWRP
jgi:pyruvate dehydrogenase E2 component (dihydrolipoamide acetyltransferase)